MFNPPPPPPPPIIRICKQEISLKTCNHLNGKNVKEDLVLYKIVNEAGKREYFGTCSLCYMTNISRKHFGKNDD